MSFREDRLVYLLHSVGDRACAGWGPGMKRITLVTIVLFCAAAIVANIPPSLIYGQTPQERRAEVFSAFISLSDTRGSEAMPFLSDLANLTGETRRRQHARLAQVRPEVIARLADEVALTPDEFVARLRDGSLADPFDHSGSVIETPDFDQYGQDGGWFWGVWTRSDKAAETAQDQPGRLEACGIWLVVWNDETWHYAPMGTDNLNQIALSATPDLLGVPFARLPDCETDA